jgi:hypothetical protein
MGLKVNFIICLAGAGEQNYEKLLIRYGGLLLLGGNLVVGFVMAA